MDKDFKGFSFEKEKITPIPSSFYTHALKTISDLAQLKVVLYAFWWHNQSELDIPYMTAQSFISDETFMSSIGDTKNSQLEALRRGIQLAVEQKILLNANLTIENKDEDIYFLNTKKSQLAIEAIQKGNWQITGNEVYPIKLKQEFPNIFTLYEKNIGPITPIIADSLKELENLYPPNWIEDAFVEAIKNNVRKLRYIEVILQNWQEEGRNDRTDRGRSQKSKEEDDPERYIKGEYSDFIEY